MACKFEGITLFGFDVYTDDTLQPREWFMVDKQRWLEHMAYKVEGLPPNVNPPYSENNNLSNIKPRLVLCQICDYVIITRLAGPKCGQCNSRMITVLNRDRQTEVLK